MAALRSAEMIKAGGHASESDGRNEGNVRTKADGNLYVDNVPIR